QAAERAHCSVGTLRRLAREGAPVYVLGPKTHRIHWPAFTEWLRRKRRWKPPSGPEAEQVEGAVT
ncbi:hypothetical protein ACFL09_04715, partial [Planctomycetota bacterium]